MHQECDPVEFANWAANPVSEPRLYRVPLASLANVHMEEALTRAGVGKSEMKRIMGRVFSSMKFDTEPFGGGAG